MGLTQAELEDAEALGNYYLQLHIDFIIRYNDTMCRKGLSFQEAYNFNISL